MLSYVGLLQSHAVKLTGNCQMKNLINSKADYVHLPSSLKGRTSKTASRTCNIFLGIFAELYNVQKNIISDYHFLIIIAFLQHENSAVFNFKTKIMLQVGKNKSYSIRGLYINRTHV